MILKPNSRRTAAKIAHNSNSVHREGGVSAVVGLTLLTIQFPRYMLVVKVTSSTSIECVSRELVVSGMIHCKYRT